MQLNSKLVDANDFFLDVDVSMDPSVGALSTMKDIRPVMIVLTLHIGFHDSNCLLSFFVWVVFIFM